MKNLVLTTSKTAFVLCLIAILSASACGGEEESQGGTTPTTSGTTCQPFICDADGKTVRQGAQGADDEYAASIGCTYKNIGTCADGCDANRTIERLPGCDVGNACTIVERPFYTDVGNVTADTSCKVETLSDTESCNGRPCLSRNINGLPQSPFFCAVTRCDANSDCAEDEFCRCTQEKQADGSYLSGRWCVKKGN